MILHITYLLLFISFFSCNQPTDNEKKIEQPNLTNPQSTTIKNLEIETFDYKEYKIKKGQLGEVKIGMTISEAEQNFDGLRKEKGYATSFGYGGGSPAYLYYENENLVLGLIPTLNTDTLLLIIAASPKLITTNGLNPNSAVKEIAEKYPNIKVNQDIMNGWEFISDTTNNWDFVFKTDENTIGDYPELEVPSELRNMDIKANWITIK